MPQNKELKRGHIERIMKQEGLVSNYTTSQFRPQKDTGNESRLKISLITNSVNNHLKML